MAHQKKIVILGAGLAGVSLAWLLSQEGYDVTIIDRNSGTAQGTSFANGGHIAAGDALPWTRLNFLFRMLSGSFRNDSALRLRLRGDMAQWQWLAQTMLSSTPKIWLYKARCLLALATFSQKCLAQRQDELKSSQSKSKMALDFDFNQKGVLHLFWGRQAQKRAQARCDLMLKYGLEAQLLDAPHCMKIEPALTKAVQYGYVSSGLLFPQDQTGDAHSFTRQISKIAQKNGVRFLFDREINGVKLSKNHISAIFVSQNEGQKEGGNEGQNKGKNKGKNKGQNKSSDEIEGDIFILALGEGSPSFAEHFGVYLPIYPVRGYSVTMETNGAHAPSIGLVDEARRVVISRFGDKLRLAGLADIGIDQSKTQSRVDFLLQAWRELLPESADVESARSWAGNRPMTPDGMPIIGKVKNIDNLYLNTGHGSLGWTLCHATAQITADLIAKRAPIIDPTPYRLDRF